MNIKDIASAAGVSVATVSRVINNKPVADATRKRVLRIMDECGYVPNMLARGLVASSTNTVGVLIADIADIFFSKQLAVVETELRKNNYNINVVCIDDNMPENLLKQQLQFLMGTHVAAYVFIGPRFQKSVVSQLLAAHSKTTPVILLNDLDKAPNIYGVVADDKKAVADTVRLLHQRGRRHFLYLYDRKNPSGRAKLKGFYEGVEGCGLEKNEKEAAVLCPRDIDKARQLAIGLLSSQKVDAILTSQDELAVGALQAAQSLGLAVPGDLSIVGYNNSVIAKACTPQLSSIDNNVGLMSEIASKTFLDLAEGKNASAQIVLSCSLIERGTT